MPSQPAHQLYMVEHLALGIRKVGKTSASRLELWRQRSWREVEVRSFADEDEVALAEALAITRLDSIGARSTPRMWQLFPNLSPNGRTEMYDPFQFGGNLTELLGEELGVKLAGRTPVVPPWIAEPRSFAAIRANERRDGKAVAAKAVATRRSRVAAAALNGPLLIPVDELYQWFVEARPDGLNLDKSTPCCNGAGRALGFNWSVRFGNGAIARRVPEPTTQVPNRSGESAEAVRRSLPNVESVSRLPDTATDRG